ncbi:hypothetical protein GCM10010489_37930 [Microbacterium saperdae]|nr:hypothetical protein GCM10010489_37930 [Microbacterium saperdae]
MHSEHAAHDFFRQRFATSREFFAAAIRDEAARGLIREGVDPDAEARKLLALADGLQLQTLSDPRIDAAAGITDALAELRVVDARTSAP